MLFVEIAMIIGFLRYFLSGKNKQDEVTYAPILIVRLKQPRQKPRKAEAKKNKKKRFGKHLLLNN